MEFRRVLFRSHGSNTRRALVSFTQHASAHAEISRGKGFTTEQEPADTDVGGGTPAPTVNAHLEAIGSASCRDIVCHYVYFSFFPFSFYSFFFFFFFFFLFFFFFFLFFFF